MGEDKQPNPSHSIHATVLVISVINIINNEITSFPWKSPKP